MLVNQPADFKGNFFLDQLVLIWIYDGKRLMSRGLRLATVEAETDISLQGEAASS